jgi:hypothetical protein
MLIAIVVGGWCVVACHHGGGRSRTAAGDPQIAPGVSQDCYDKALAAYKDCVAGCKGRSDTFNCCGECDTLFSTTFTNCCNDQCKVDNPPKSCEDDSAPGCAGGAITHDQARPSYCDEEPEASQAAH